MRANGIVSTRLKHGFDLQSARWFSFDILMIVYLQPLHFPQHTNDRCTTNDPNLTHNHTDKNARRNIIMQTQNPQTIHALPSTQLTINTHFPNTCNSARQPRTRFTIRRIQQLVYPLNFIMIPESPISFQTKESRRTASENL
jgi:hypothetical protein